MVNQENMRKVVAALRSGEFPQAKGSLRGSDGYCCLGVICELYRRETGQGQWVSRADHRYEFHADDNRANWEVAVMPRPVWQWLGTTANPEFPPREFEDADDCETFTVTATSAANWNDNGATFDEIADAFEATYLR